MTADSGSAWHPSNNLSVQRRHAQLSGGTLERSLHAHSGTDCCRNGLPPGAEKPRVAWKEQQNLEQLLNRWWEEETWILGVQGGEGGSRGLWEFSSWGLFLISHLKWSECLTD